MIEALKQLNLLLKSSLFVLDTYHLPGTIFFQTSRIALTCHVNSIPFHNYFLNGPVNNFSFPLKC